MDYGVDSETPPSSPIIGLGGISATREFNNEELSFECRGSIQSNDSSFSPQGLIGRGDLISTIKLLNNNNASFDDRFDAEDTQYTFFNFPFQPSLDSLRLFIQICRKNIAILENLAQPVSILYSSDESSQFKPWDLRREVGVFLNFVLNHHNYFRQLDEDFVELFNGIRNSLEKIDGWPTVLKSHGGSHEGNKCPSPYYHFFHLHLELRWFFLILSGLSTKMIDWVLDDLIYLGWFMYTADRPGWNFRLSRQNAFNCYCVKELWTMILHVVNEIRPQGKEFWDLFTSALNRFDKHRNDVLFPLWLIVKIAPLEKYSLTGQFCMLTSPNSSARDDSSSNCYNFVRELVTACLKESDNNTTNISSEIIDLLYKLLSYWGSDENVIYMLWDHWCGKIGKNVGLQDFNYWKSPVKWLSFVKSISGCDSKDSALPSATAITTTTMTTTSIANVDNVFATDEFLQFIRLFCGHIRYCKDKKKRQKLINRVYVKFPKGKVCAFKHEMGLVRLSTLHLGIICAVAAITSSEEKDVVAACRSCSTHFIEIYDELVSQRNKMMNSAKTVFTAHLTIVLLLLDRSVNITDTVSPFMEKISQLMLRESTIQITNKKELIMLYLEALDSLSKFGSTQDDLGQVNFYSPYISIWLANAGPEYTNRTLRVLHSILVWLLGSSRHHQQQQLGHTEVFARKIRESTKQFLGEAVCRIQNRTSQNDVEPLADLAADLTYFERNDRILFSQLFDQFALDVRTSPEISQLYMDKILNFDVEKPAAEQIEIEDLKLLQVWIRLVCVGANVPHKLTLGVLTAANNFVGQSNQHLLTIFCKHASSNDDWERKDVETILQPFLRVCDKSWKPLKDHVIIVQSILRSAAIILIRLKFQKLYVRNYPCVAQTIFKIINEYLMTMPVELENVLVEYLPKVFDSVTSYPNWNNDPYLRSQALNFLTYAFTAFSRDNFLRNFTDHPAVKILKKATANYNNVVLSEFLPEMKSIASDQKLNGHTAYLKTLLIFSKKNLELISIIGKSLPMVLKITRLASNSTTDIAMCCEILCSLFDPAYGDSNVSKLNPDCASVILELQLESAIRNELEQNLSLHSKKYFSLFKRLATHRSQFRDKVVRFLKEKLLPIVKEQIELSEVKRGHGQDYALRTQYHTLEADLNRLA